MNTNTDLIRVQDLVNNPMTRVPICLCLDTSATMGTVEGDDLVFTGRTYYEDGRTWNIVEGGTSRLDELKKGVELFYKSIREDEIAAYSAEICIVTFDSRAECIRDFSTMDCQGDVPELCAGGETFMGEGINLALDLLEKRKKEYQQNGVDYYQPWLVVMTDGEPNGDEEELERAIERTRELVQRRKLTIFPIGVGGEADLNVLNRLSPKRPALKLCDLRFEEFFSWLSRSVSQTSNSMPGDVVKVDVKGIEAWGTLEL